MTFFRYYQSYILQRLNCDKSGLNTCALLVTLSLSGCGSQPITTEETQEPFENIAELRTNYLELANRSSGIEAEQYRLLALKQSILNQDEDLAEQLYNQIDTYLLSRVELNSMMLSRIALPSAFSTSSERLSALESLVPSPRDVPEWNYYMAATLNEIGSREMASELYYSCSNLIPSEIDYRDVCSENLWRILVYSDKGYSEGLGEIERNYRGWQELAYVARNNTGLIESQIQFLQNWLSKYSDHPAYQNPPAQILELLEPNVAPLNSIALVLPLSGRLQSAGEAVLDGFLSAAYNTGAQGYHLPKIEIFDSDTLPVELIAEIISSDNFDIAIGPLDTNSVENFSRAVSSELPTIYLNSLPEGYYNALTHLGFSLAVENEAQQAAQTAISRGYKSALVLTEDSEIGDRAAGAFAEDWLVEDRKIYDLVRLTDAISLTERLEQSFHIDQSESRRSQLQTLLGKRLEFTPRRRQDIDTIFLATNSVLAKQVTPTLAFLFAQDIPVLATSRVFDDNVDPEENIDLATLSFLAPSWLVNTNQSLQQSDSRRPLELQKLEAMGVDAFYLSRRFRQLEDPDFRYQGKTGRLSVGNDGNLRITMEWVKIDGEEMVLAN